MKAVWREKDDKKRYEGKLFGLTEYFVDENILIASLPPKGRFKVNIWKGAALKETPDKEIVIDK